MRHDDDDPFAAGEAKSAGTPMTIGRERLRRRGMRAGMAGEVFGAMIPPGAAPVPLIQSNPARTARC
jgi:hypothetical protein